MYLLNFTFQHKDGPELVSNAILFPDFLVISLRIFKVPDKNSKGTAGNVTKTQIFTNHVLYPYSICFKKDFLEH